MDKAFPVYEKLSKKLLMQLPTGVFLVSNCYMPMGHRTVTPVFAERITALDDREAQWERIKDSGANGRNCEIHKNSESYKCQRQALTQSSDKFPAVVLLEIDDYRKE